MNETCDRCGPAVRAIYRVFRRGEPYLCRHCTNQLQAELSAQGWAVWPVGGRRSRRELTNSRAPREGAGVIASGTLDLSPGLIRPPGPVLARQRRQVIRGTAQGRVRCGM
jgi:hypothetical protein